MKHVLAILILLILMVGCAPSGNTVTNQPQTPAADVNKGSQVPPIDNDSIAKARISALESELANCQSTNIKLQKQLDQAAQPAKILSSKEPVSGDLGFYTMKFDKPGLQYPNKYLVWDITGMDCGAFDRCTLKSALTNNHPKLVMTNITINDESIGSAGTNAKIIPGETFITTKNLPMPKVVDFQMTLRWVWQ